ncbi:MAG: TonB-dependent receptor [Woeseiaceae bacterium]
MPESTVFAQGAVLEEIVVTARKREESLQTVPITMQAFTGEQIQNFGVLKVTDITKLAPNLNVVVQNALSHHIVIRGVGTNEFFGNAASSVGTYMDEVTMNSSYMSTLGLFDIERVEILRGPQNSLFGRNTTGGAVNYISMMPVVGEDASGYATLTYGRYNLLNFEGAASFALGDTTAGRLAAMVRTADGRWNNITQPDDEYGDQERYSVRGTLVWEPSDATTVTGSFHVARDRSQAQAQKAFGTLDNNPPLRLDDEQTIFGNLGASDIDFETAVPWVTSQGLDVSTPNWDDVRTGASQRGDLDVDGGYIKIEHDFGNVTLTSITAYDETHAFYEEDNGVSGLNAGPNTEALVIDMDQEYEQFSQELRLASTDDSASFRWIAGLYYFTQDSTLAQNIRFGDNGVLAFHPAFNGAPVPPDAIPNPYGSTLSFSIADLEDDSFSAYVHTNYDFTDRLTLTAGVRFTKDDKANPSYYAGAMEIIGMPQSTYYDRALVTQMASALPGCPQIDFVTVFPFNNNCANTNTSRSNIEDEEIGGKIGLDYRVSDDVMIYGSFSRGFKSGKFDVEFLHTDDTPFPQRSLEEETLDAFEVGFKSTLQDGRLQLNGALFKYIWKDLQVFNVGAAGPEFFNLPESEISGFELEMKWAPAETWLISAGLGWLDSEITDTTGVDFDLGQGAFQLGHELVLAPDFSGNFAVLKDIDINQNTLTLQLDGRYQTASKAKYQPSSPIDEYESRFEINARGTYAFGESQKYQLAVFLDNLTEEKYCVEKQDLHALVGAYYCVPNLGEMQWGLQGRINF